MGMSARRWSGAPDGAGVRRLLGGRRSPSPLRARWPLLMRRPGEFRSVQVVTRALAFVGGSAGVSSDQ